MPFSDSLAIVGPTASGKSSLALALAEAIAGSELVSVDSMQVYRTMDIGTAKPTAAEQAAVPHHLIDLLEPSEESSVAWFAEQADSVRCDLARREVTPILVGGTGLYHRAVVDGLDIPGQWPDLVAELERVPDPAALHARLTGLDPLAASRIEPTNRRRLIRALEVTIGSGRLFSDSGAGLTSYTPSSTVLVGLDLERDLLTERIRRRLDDQLERGFLAEVEALLRRPDGWSRTAAQALGYRELSEVIRGTESLEAQRAVTLLRTRRFAVRQLRWFRRDPRITWFDATSQHLVADVVAHWRKSSTR